MATSEGAEWDCNSRIVTQASTHPGKLVLLLLSVLTGSNSSRFRQNTNSVQGECRLKEARVTREPKQVCSKVGTIVHTQGMQAQAERFMY